MSFSFRNADGAASLKWDNSEARFHDSEEKCEMNGFRTPSVSALGWITPGFVVYKDDG